MDVTIVKPPRWHSVVATVVGLVLFVPSALQVNYEFLPAGTLRFLPPLVGVLGLAILYVGVKNLRAWR